MLTYKNRTPDVTLAKFKHRKRQTYSNCQLKGSRTLSILQYSRWKVYSPSWSIWATSLEFERHSHASVKTASMETAWDSVSSGLGYPHIGFIVCSSELVAAWSLKLQVGLDLTVPALAASSVCRRGMSMSSFLGTIPSSSVVESIVGEETFSLLWLSPFCKMQEKEKTFQAYSMQLLQVISSTTMCFL